MSHWTVVGYGFTIIGLLTLLGVGHEPDMRTVAYLICVAIMMLCFIRGRQER